MQIPTEPAEQMFPKNIAPLLDSGSLAPIAANASLEQATLLRWGGSCVQHRLPQGKSNQVFDRLRNIVGLDFVCATVCRDVG
jgi:hypothetical protein